MAYPNWYIEISVSIKESCQTCKSPLKGLAFAYRTGVIALPLPCEIQLNVQGYIQKINILKTTWGYRYMNGVNIVILRQRPCILKTLTFTVGNCEGFH